MILQKDAGWEVPLENFEKATAGLQARLDAMIAATAEELGDIAPNTGAFSVRNRSKETALVLTVTIRLVEGN